MTTRDDDRFRPRVRPPRARGDARTSPFIKRVVQSASKAGSTPGGTPGHSRRPRPGARLGRGYVAARLAGDRIGPRSRRVIIKTRLVVLKTASPRSIAKHLRYIQRDGVTREGGRGELFGPHTDAADAQAFEERTRNDRHQFRFIVSPEDAADLGDLKSFTRDWMSQVEKDLGTRLDWVAVDHWDTDNPHTHIVLRGRDDTGHDLIIAGDYIAHAMRHRAADVATEWLGPRTEREIQESLTREIGQERWTSLDRTIQQQMRGGIVDLRDAPSGPEGKHQRALLVGRLGHLTDMKLAERVERGIWSVSPDAEQTLRTMGEKGDIIRTMQRAFTRERREYAIFNARASTAPVTGRIVTKGLGDELRDQGYLIVDGVDGRAHHIVLATTIDLTAVPLGAVVTVRSAAEPRAADRTIAALAQDGIYRTARHVEVAQADAKRGFDPAAFVDAHVRRLEALRRAGIVERVEDGIWRVPADLVGRGQAYDVQRANGALVDVHSYVPIERQTRAIGATWLDRQLIHGAEDFSTKGFGAAARQALDERKAFLVEHGFAERQGSRVILARDLLATLRARELDSAAKAIASETGLMYRPVADGGRVSGIYRRAIAFASGRFAMLDDGAGFSLVPWRPVIDSRLGRTVSAVVHGESVSWSFGRQRGLTR
ncbi:MAG: relaxase/mobilization nuclease and DUF3363 domain-containing protein [Gammaproteobacteria bacterium]